MTEILNDDVVKLVFCHNIRGNESGIRWPARDRRRRIASNAANTRWAKELDRFICRMQIIVLLIIVKRRPAK